MRPIALCLGGAKCVWSDLERARELVGERPVLIVACNYAGIQYPGHIDGWATLHPERFQGWREERAARGFNTDYRAFSYQPQHGCQFEVVRRDYHTSSGVYAALVALKAMQAGGAILCGVPMDDKAGHIHWRGDWVHSHHYLAGIKEVREAGFNIRSMSGWTADLFGLPDADFLGEG